MRANPWNICRDAQNSPSVLREFQTTLARKILLEMHSSGIVEKFARVQGYPTKSYYKIKNREDNGLRRLSYLVLQDVRPDNIVMIDSNVEIIHRV